VGTILLGWGRALGLVAILGGCGGPAFAEASSSTEGQDAASKGQDEAPACAACLQSKCATAASACGSDPACSTTLACIVAAGCFGPDAGQAMTACGEKCTADEGLSLKAATQVAQELSAFDPCLGPCLPSCAD